MKPSTSAFSRSSVAQRMLVSRPDSEELGSRIRLLWGIFGRRLAEMPPWMADEFSNLLLGAARGPIRDFEVRCGMLRLVRGLHCAVRETEHGRMGEESGEA